MEQAEGSFPPPVTLRVSGVEAMKEPVQHRFLALYRLHTRAGWQRESLKVETLLGGLAPGFSFDALPLDPDFGTFRPAEAFCHAIAFNDQPQIVTRSHAADPVRKS